jgi:hypothetical protein
VFWGVSNVSVLKWIRALGEKIEDLRKTTVEPAPAAVIVDEMCHFVHPKKDSSGAGLAFVIAHTRLSGSFVVIGQDAALDAALGLSWGSAQKHEPAAQNPVHHR